MILYYELNFFCELYYEPYYFACIYTIIVEYLMQVCKENSTIGEIDVNAICTHLKCYDYSSAYETLYDICTEELKNQYPLLETILEELRNHE